MHLLRIKMEHKNLVSVMTNDRKDQEEKTDKDTEKELNLITAKHSELRAPYFSWLLYAHKTQ